MRTKTLLLTAALTAAGTLASMAQVYSVNMVGYINLQIPQGFSMIANQLNNGSLNQLAELIPAPPNNSMFFKYKPASGTYDIDSFVDGAYEGDTAGTMTMNAGEGIWINAMAAFTATFVGEVVTGHSELNVVPGYSIISSVIPQQGFIDTDLGYGVPNNGSQFYQWQNAGGAYRINSFVDSAWEGDDGGNPPTIHVGEAFFVLNTAATDHKWVRDFAVGP